MLCKQSALDFQRLMEYVLRLRMKLHLYYGAEAEDVYHPNYHSADPKSAIHRLLKEEEMLKLKHFYQFLLLLEVNFRSAFKTAHPADKKKWFKTTLELTDPGKTEYFQARLYERFFDPNQALTAYQAAKDLDPTNLDIRLYYQAFLAKKLRDPRELANKPRAEDYKEWAQKNLNEIVSVLWAGEPQIFHYMALYRRLDPMFQRAFLITLDEKKQQLSPKMPIKT